MKKLNNEELAHLIDHTNLKQDAKISDIEKLCLEAKEHHFFSVCINPCYVSHCHEYLKDSDVKICTVIGFPLGANSTSIKVQESLKAIDDGADEIDMVINVGLMKSGKYEDVKNDIKSVVEAAHQNKDKKIIVKVIIEECLLSKEEIIEACKMVMDAKADFIKTSTGFSTSGATVDTIKLMKDTLKDGTCIKAAGGIRTLETVLSMLDAGSNRIGCSSSIDILKENLL